MKEIIYRIDGINVIADYDSKTIYVPKGAFKNKANFIQKWYEACMLSFVNQVCIELRGCVDSASWDIYKACLQRKDTEAYSITLDTLHQFDDFRIYERLD